MSDDNLDAVKIEAVVPKKLAKALERVHDRRVSNLSSGRRSKWNFTEREDRAEEMSTGAKLVKLALDGNMSQKEVRRTIQDSREDEEKDGLRYL